MPLSSVILDRGLTIFDFRFGMAQYYVSQYSPRFQPWEHKRRRLSLRPQG